MRDGCILVGDVGSGKTLTSLSYYKEKHPLLNLVVITAAMKRDTHDWEDEAALLGIYNLNSSLDKEPITVDSWHNIVKYVNRTNTFFIFDEQRLVGYGAWVKSFLKISKNNPWILLSATPADRLVDYCPVFIANKFYRNKTEFYDLHVEKDPYQTYRIKKYHNEGKLHNLRKSIEIRMIDTRKTERVEITHKVEYDREMFNTVLYDRWDPFKNKPIETWSGMIIPMRSILSNDITKIRELNKLLLEHQRVIIFYQYNIELEVIVTLCELMGLNIYQRNGKQHDEIPTTGSWVYIVQYASGCEGWNCVQTNQMIFFSPSYSYRTDEQAKGRIDRMNTKFNKLYYHYLESNSPLDIGIRKALLKKKKFNKSNFFNQ